MLQVVEEQILTATNGYGADAVIIAAATDSLRSY